MPKSNQTDAQKEQAKKQKAKENRVRGSAETQRDIDVLKAKEDGKWLSGGPNARAGAGQKAVDKHRKAEAKNKEAARVKKPKSEANPRGVASKGKK